MHGAAPDSLSVSRWHSLDRRLPLLISALLVLTVAALVIGAYESMRKVSLAAAAARMEGSAQQLATLLRVSAAQRQEEVRALAANPSVHAVLADPGDADAGEEAKHALASAVQPQTMAIELRAADGRPVLVVPGPALRPGEPQPRDSLSPRPGLSPVRAAGNVVYDESGAPISPARGGPAGLLVARRRLSSPETARTLSALIGANARLLLGSAGGVWTDLSSVVPAPVARSAQRTRDRASVVDRQQLSVVLPIEGTPWHVCLQTPTTAVLAPVHSFLIRLSGISIAVVLLAAVAAHLFARRITRRLERLTAAAEGVATRSVEVPVPQGGRDEIGRLAAAFDAMRCRIVANHQELEGRVEARTLELREAVGRLEAAQVELVRNERLAMLGQLASSVGHELRNPLAVMTNALFYLDMVLEDESSEVRDYLGILRHEIRLSEKIVTDLLDFARLKSPQRTDVDLAALADEQLARLGPTPTVLIDRRIPADLPAAFADPVQVGQVFFNLAINAVQAMAEGGGTLTVEGRAAGDDKVELVVRDQGPGVATELRERVFEPLFTTKARGIGLGLAVSRRLAESNGGELRLLDEHGPGATFALRLPVAPGETP